MVLKKSRRPRSVYWMSSQRKDRQKAGGEQTNMAFPLDSLRDQPVGGVSPAVPINLVEIISFHPVISNEDRI